MTTVSVSEIQRDLLGYLRLVEAGETLVILQDDRPVAEIRPVPTSLKQPRPFGLCAGEFTVPPDFDQPLFQGQ
ncbi:MAG: type II toxin-antitoxin system Phd/YefM family antitoxin [Planctomycetes bacterium]|nr:type II toxin-antitoxin system Phd/YefM family antitoxin [Planctomycetota bacterium]